ncbi:glycosyltransferase family 2 protein [uncultured Arthrobacter sp.]|uniref:glycosyltransferase family 2 protein n=1 Tax=uncultured Arthrobacter sp. TaxID=114050 RepID=UPI0028D8C253|nr:glycosyltransferase family 2 protein [uncultured Arthrobacter sp.]
MEAAEYLAIPFNAARSMERSPMPNSMDAFLSILGPILFVGVSIIGVRMALYWWSFLFRWKRYRRRTPVSNGDLRALDVPFVKIQITTRGSAGSTEVITRGIRNVVDLVREDPEFYSRFLSVEVVTESAEQSFALGNAFHGSPVPVSTLVIPENYETPNGTRLKARGLHYIVEQRRKSWNRKPGRTFIVHYDEESVMVPVELRKLIHCLAGTDKKILEGPIYYPLEYMNATPLCRGMEANRPIGCYECRHVMETGVPLHLHGSNLVIDERLENEIGWDIGCLEGQPFIAEDYVFGMKALTRYGTEVFGWHGCVMLEQPPFSVRSAFKQRYRWIFGVLQGMKSMTGNPLFLSLPWATRLSLVWGTRYRVGTFALGAVVGVLSAVVFPAFIVHALESLLSDGEPPLPAPGSAWLALVGVMWMGSVFIGAWHNVADSGMNRWARAGEISLAVLLAPVAGLVESSAALWAVFEWTVGKRGVHWVPTPKTKKADLQSIRSGE